MISNAQLTAIRALGEAYMITTVVITPKAEFAKETGEDEFDDTPTFGTPITTHGWIAPIISAGGFDIEAGSMLTVGEFRLRLPVGTHCPIGSKVTAGGLEYTVTEEASEQSWPEWLNVRMRLRQ